MRRELARPSRASLSVSSHFVVIQLTVPADELHGIVALSKGPPGRRARLRERAIVRSLVSDSARTGAATRALARVRIYASVCPPAHNCGRAAATRVLNAPCKVTVFQPAVTPDDVIVSRLPRLVSVFRNDGRARCRRDVWPTSVTNSLDTLCAREIRRGRY